MNEQPTLSELEIKFPRIVERIVELWNKDDLDKYLNELMIDDRGNRHGFPEETASELLFLRTLHDYHMRGITAGKPDSHTVWGNPEYTKTSGHDGAD